MTDPRAALSVLMELTRKLTEERPLEDALELITDAALQLLPGTHASIRVLDDTASVLLCGARSGVGRDTRPITFRRSEGVGGWVVEHGAVVRLDDVDADARFVRHGEQRFAIGSMLATPLLAAGKVIGVLAITARQRSAFGVEDEDLARLLANCAVPPIERSRLERLVATDHQTLALTQRYLYPKLEEEIDRARRAGAPLSVLLLDLDHFKAVNDAHGHAAGDEVLRAFADRVRARVRRSDVLIRRGGEEFVLLMPGARDPEARNAASRIREGTRAETFTVGSGVEVRQTVSIGVATWDGQEDGAALEARADAAMYEAKRRGRDQVVVQ